MPRVEILEDLFWKIPVPISASDGDTPLWARRLGAAGGPHFPQGLHLLFVRLAFMSREHILDAQHAVELFKRLHRRRYRERMESDAVLLRDLTDYFQDVARTADPNTVDPIITLMATLNQVPEIQNALQKGLSGSGQGADRAF